MSFSNPAAYLINFQKKIIRSCTALVQSSVIKNFFIYSCGSIMLRGMAIFLAPITLHVLTPADYGLFSLVTSFNNIFIACIGLGLRQVFYIEYFHCDDRQRKQMTNTIILLYSLAALPIIGVMLSSTSLINALVFNNNASPSLITLCMFYCFMFFFVELFYQHVQYACKALELTLLQMSVALITLLGTVLFLYYLRWHIYGILLGYILGMLIVIAIAAYHYRKNNYWETFSFARSRKKILPYIILGIPFIPSILFAWMLSSGDKWVLTHYATMHDVGIYAIADAFSQLFYMLILYPMSGSYLPWLFKQFAHNKDNLLPTELYNKKIMYWCMLGMAVAISACYLIFKPVLFWILPHHYHEAIQYIWLILMGNVFLMGTYFSSAIIQFHKKTYFLACALCLPALANVGLNIVLIPHYGIYGCAGATLLAYIGYFLLTLWYNKSLCRKLITS